MARTKPSTDRSHRRRRLLPASGLLAALLTAALLDSPPAMTASEPARLEGSAWVLTTLSGRPVLAETEATLRFEAGRAAGSDGCNRFSAPFTATGSALGISERMIGTQMACAPAVMDQGRAFRAALTQARRYRITGPTLQLLGADRTPLAVLAAQSQNLANTSWQVTGYNNGKQAVVSPIVGSALTLDFGAGGRVSGSAGCNRFQSRARIEGARLSFSPPSASRRLCNQPPGVMEQERQFLKALESVARSQLEGSRLELRREDGALALSLVRSSATGVSGKAGGR
jgi:heat shock protein HslJ